MFNIKCNGKYIFEKQINANFINPVDRRFFNGMIEIFVVEPSKSDREVWKVDMGKRADLGDQTVSHLGCLDSVCL